MIYFFVFPPDPPFRAAYQHELICLAEGLKELGVSFYSNINYWKPSPEENYLFKFSPKIIPSECFAVILASEWMTYGKGLPKNFFIDYEKTKKIFMAVRGNSDFLNEEFCKNFDFIFRGQFNSRTRYPKNFYPWAFGLTNRIIQSTQAVLPFEERRKNIISNPRVSHQVRKLASDQFIPRISEFFEVDTTTDNLNIELSNIYSDYDKLQWYQTGRRHYSAYYKRLTQSQACSTFGGKFSQRGSNSPKKFYNIARNCLNSLGMKKDKVVHWDSWRFWESLAAGCLTFHVDFDLYGIKLPIMPQNWEHYIGVDLDNVDFFIEKIMRHSEELERISLNGRQWALEHYSPKATAIRFLKTIGY